MDEALALFDASQPRVRHTDPRTSHNARNRVAAVTPSLRVEILALLAQRALTADGICTVLDIPTRRWPTVKTLLSRMRKAGELVWTGDELHGQNLWTVPQNASARVVPIRSEML